jgi:hypothetical protein
MKANSAFARLRHRGIHSSFQLFKETKQQNLKGAALYRASKMVSNPGITQTATNIYASSGTSTVKKRKFTAERINLSTSVLVSA